MTRFRAQSLWQSAYSRAGSQRLGKRDRRPLTDDNCLDSYQLLPLRKAFDLPRVNLLIPDDVGLGKTIEETLILRELLLLRRIDFALVAAPASMTLRWEDELRSKFGLAFKVVDREFVGAMRRQHGFAINVWCTGAAFIVSHSLLIDETYAADLRAAMGAFRPRSLLILDETHHAARASGSHYASAIAAVA